jgi:RIO kinase 1
MADENPTPLSAVAAETQRGYSVHAARRGAQGPSNTVLAAALFSLPPPRSFPTTSRSLPGPADGDDGDDDDWDDGEDYDDDGYEDGGAYNDYDNGGLVASGGACFGRSAEVPRSARARDACARTAAPLPHPLFSQARADPPLCPFALFPFADVISAFQESVDVPAGAASASTAASATATAAAASAATSSAGRRNPQPAPLRELRAQPREHQLDRYRDRINLGAVHEAAAEEGVVRHTGRDDRATVEQVLDPRTRLILFKLLNSGTIAEVNGCVSTGKEANVYHARSPDGSSLALKIYKTSILVFKDRDRYVSGEFRFRSGYSRSNPRKMVRVWAEKEMRNLKRLHAAGFLVPYPHLLRSHVLVMDFLGDDGWPAPRLRDAGLGPSKLGGAYIEVVDVMRGMFQKCRLVHADLSEYNLLVHEGRVVLIDVSQSVETDHPRALEFLRIDCQNISDYFRRSGVLTMTPRELFDYVVHAALPTREDEQNYLDAMRARAEERAVGGGTEEADNGAANGDETSAGAGAVAPSTSSAAAPQAAAAVAAKATAKAKAADESVEHAVFMQAYIPNSLFAVRDAEAETAKVISGQAGQLYYGALTGLVAAPGGKGDGEGGEGEGKAAAEAEARGAPGEGESGEDEEGSEEDDSGEDGSEGEEEGAGARPPGLPSRKDLSKEEWKAVKAAAKEAQRERRKTKLPKHVKKRHTKAKK